MTSKQDKVLHQTTILIVEDSPTQALQLQHLLEEAEYQVLVAQNGQEALTLLKNHQPTLIISDILMPGMDGFELCKNIKHNESLKKIPVVLLTSLSDPHDVIRGLECGASNFITKPYEATDLLNRLQYILINQELRKGQIGELVVEVYFSGKKYFITADRMQIIDLLFSSYENAIQKNRDLTKTNKELADTQQKLKTLNEQLEKKIMERTRKLSALNKVILATRNVNQLIVKEKNRDKLIKEACKELVESRYYHSAWIVLLDDSGKVEMGAEAGLGEKFGPLFNQLKHGEVLPCFQKALNQSDPVIIADPLLTCPHCLHPQKHSSQAGMAVRLENEGKVYGVLSVCAPSGVAQDKEEQSLFKEVAGDIAFALYSIELNEMRRRAEQDLRESETRYRRLIETMNEGLAVTDKDFRLTFMNERFCEMLEYSRYELMGHRIGEFIPEDFQGMLEEQLNRRKRGETEPYEMAWKKKGGATIHTQVSPKVLFDDQGNYLGSIGVLTDITERKRAEEILRESEERFRGIFEQAAVGIAQVDLDGRWLLMNQRLCEIVGYRREELLVKTFQDITHPDDLETDLNYVRQMLAGEIRTYSMEKRYIQKDGSIVWVNLSVGLMRKADGTPGYFISVYEDINRRKQVEEALQRSEDEARRLAHENAVIAEIGRIISSTLNIEEVYDRFAQEVKKLIPFDRIVVNTLDLKHQRLTIVYVSGYDIPSLRPGDYISLDDTMGEELLKRRSSLLMRPEKEEEWKYFPALLSAFQLGIRSLIAVPLLSKDQVIGFLSLHSLGPKAFTEADLQVAERVSNQIAGAIANAQLFLQHERSEAEKTSLEAQLQQSQKMEAIGRLAGGVAHDFNNLLTVISIQSQLSVLGLREGDPLRENLQEIEKAADRAANLTRQLLAFSRRQILDIKVLNLNTIVSDLEKMLHRILGEDLELATMLADDLGMAKVDLGQMEQVIVNLAVNAKDAMPQGGKLTIETANVELDEKYGGSHFGVMPGSYVLLSVSDTGVGMSKEVKEQIFDPFFTTKEKGKGTGLGLSTVYGIVKQSGGEIFVYSEVGHGTTFNIYFPRVFEPGEELAKKEAGGEIHRGDETILVVEDDDMVRKLARDILRTQGYTVLEAEAGGEALLVCEQYKGPIHLILTDVVMPHMSGTQFIERLKQARKDFKVLYMTGYAENAITHHGLLEKGLNLIPKPFTLEKLARKVREVLDKN